MALAPLPAHLICLSLVVIDVAARAARLRVLVGAFGAVIAHWDALRANLVEDAAAGLTPMRLGGQPARVAMLARAGLPARTIIAVSVAEAAVMYPVVMVAAAATVLAFAPDWWSTVGPSIAHSATRSGRWLALGGALAIIGWIAMRRLLPRHHHTARRTLVDSWNDLRRTNRAAVVESALLSLVSVGARVSILPVLVSTLPQAPELGVIVLSSFAFLYGQLILPTPSGAGVVEVGFLAGGAGVSGHEARHILLAWRIYTSLLSVVAGCLVALAAGGATWRGRRGATSRCDGTMRW